MMNSSDVLSSDSDEDYEDINVKYNLNIIVPIIWSLIILMGVVGNGIIIYVILKRRLYKKSCTNCYIINVAISDLCFTLICVPVTMTAYVYKEWIFGEFMCQFQNLLMFASIQAACLTLTAMTIDRYAAILYPFKSLEFRTTKMAFKINILIWIASFILNIPYYMYYNQQIHFQHENETQGVKYCVSSFPRVNISISFVNISQVDFDMEIVLTIYTVMISYVLPLLTIIFCYAPMIGKILSKSPNQKLLDRAKNYSMKKRKESPTRIRSEARFSLTEDPLQSALFINQMNEREDGMTSTSQNSRNSKAIISENLNESTYLKRETLLKRKHSKSNLFRTYSVKQTNTIRKQKIKILILIGTVSLTFALTWLPAHVIRIWKVIFHASFPYSDVMYIAKFIAHTLTYSNSVLNPFIYVFIGSKFRGHIYTELELLFQSCFLNVKRNKTQTKISLNNLNELKLNKKDVSFDYKQNNLSPMSKRVKN